jgi:hypothetical protein
VLGVAGLAPPAQACSPEGESIVEASVPAPGSQLVPTNVVLYVAGKTLVPGELVLETAAGERMPITVSPVHPAGYDIRPASELMPATLYYLKRIRASSAERTEVFFMTDSGPAAPGAPPAPPDLTGATVVHDIDAICGGAQWLCLNPSPPRSALIATSDAEDTVYEYNAGSLPFTSGCRQVWRRDMFGNHSDVVQVCGEDLPIVEVQGGQNGLPCADYRESLDGGAAITDAATPEGGCSIASSGTPASGEAFARGLAACLLAALVARRKRAHAPGRRSA